jgi:hypothetical protein
LRPPADRRTGGWRYREPGAVLALHKASVSPGSCCWNPGTSLQCPLRGIASSSLDALDIEWRFFMSRVGLADNSLSEQQGVADHGSGRSVHFPQAAENMKVNFHNQFRQGHFASIPAQVDGANRDIEALNAGCVTRFAAGRGTTGFEVAHLPCLNEAIPTLSTYNNED